MRSLDEVFRYSVLAVVLFIAFARVDSPQWLLWYAPMALMFVRETSTVSWLALLTLLTYLVFPIAYDNVGPLLRAYDLRIVGVFSAIVLLKDLVLLGWLWRVFAEAEPTPRR